MSNSQSYWKNIYLFTLDESLRLHTVKLKKLQRFWIPLQKRAPTLVLALLLIGVSVSLVTQSYCHWLLTAPVLFTLIVVDIIIEEVQIKLFFIIDEKRHLLTVARQNHFRHGGGLNSNLAHR